MPRLAKDMDKDKGKQILCPRCDYRPQLEDRWQCVPRCGTLWHTFWTAGVCPGCAMRWPLTQCPSCGAVSPHRQWYREPERTHDEQHHREHEHEHDREHADLLEQR